MKIASKVRLCPYKWVLKHNHDYKQAAQKFDITYSRAYAWT
ncbi:helix-turn-helix domain-containing protein, partial [Limosilactobacillus fermentum]|nr:helix-turn-helix domain-containing protein [Limosilactobacillus fermentum]